MSDVSTTVPTAPTRHEPLQMQSKSESGVRGQSRGHRRGTGGKGGVLIVAGETRRLAVLTHLVVEDDALTLVQTAANLADVELAVDRLDVDVVVVDADSLGSESPEIVGRARASHPRSVVVFSSRSVSPPDRSQLSPSILEHGDPVHLNAVSIRLGLIANRNSCSRTQGKTGQR